MTRIRTVILRAGTRYRLLGLICAEPRVLERDVEVEVRRLAFEPGEVAAYVWNRQVVLWSSSATSGAVRGRRRDEASGAGRRACRAARRLP